MDDEEEKVAKTQRNNAEQEQKLAIIEATDKQMINNLSNSINAKNAKLSAANQFIEDIMNGKRDNNGRLLQTEKKNKMLKSEIDELKQIITTMKQHEADERIDLLKVLTKRVTQIEEMNEKNQKKMETADEHECARLKQLDAELNKQRRKYEDLLKELNAMQFDSTRVSKQTLQKSNVQIKYAVRTVDAFINRLK
jgi:hypothetical protein